MRIVDCFPYFNEEELLELRIKLLLPYVDRFIITEADHTHKGDKKNFSCKHALKKIGLLSDKIQVVELNVPSYSQEQEAIVRERTQRDEAAKYVDRSDILLVSDCDEIINPDFLENHIELAKNNPNNIVRFSLMILNCRADIRVYEKNNLPLTCYTPFICMNHHLESYTLSQIRESYTISYPTKYPNITINNGGIIEDAGWHFSWMGDDEKRSTKLRSFLHWSEYDKLYNIDTYENDILGRKYSLKKIPHSALPNLIMDSPHIKQFLLPNE